MLDSSSWNWTEPAEPSPGPPAQTRKFEVVHLGGAASAVLAVLAVLAVCAAGWPGAARATAGIRMAAPMAPATALTRRAVRLVRFMVAPVSGRAELAPLRQSVRPRGCGFFMITTVLPRRFAADRSRSWSARAVRPVCGLRRLC